MMDWAIFAADFEFDGSWRDIYVLDTGLDDWRAVWAVLLGLVPRPVLNSADCSGPMPQLLDWTGQLAHGRAHLAVEFSKITFNCHFFDDSVIEFDFDPRSVKGPSDAEDVAQFMALLGRATGKTVILTWENSLDAVIARYAPACAEVAWLPVAKPASNGG
jgi:hypothetical protein